jgi:hypothetical protein
MVLGQIVAHHPTHHTDALRPEQAAALICAAGPNKLAFQM